MNNGVAIIIGFIGGSAIGGGAAYYFTKKNLEKKCQKEISEARATYRKMKEEALAAQKEALAAKETAEKSEARASKAEQTLFELNKHKDSKDWLFGGVDTHKTSYTSNRTEMTEEAKDILGVYKPNEKNDINQNAYSVLADTEQEKPSESEDEDDNSDGEEIDIVEQAFPEIIDKQVVIDPELYGVNEDYDMISITKYADGVFADDHLMKIDQSKIFKMSILKEIEECGDGSICIQDNERQVYYEIILEDDLTYKKAIT